MLDQLKLGERYDIKLVAMLSNCQSLPDLRTKARKLNWATACMPFNQKM